MVRSCLDAVCSSGSKNESRLELQKAARMMGQDGRGNTIMTGDKENPHLLNIGIQSLTMGY